MRKASFLVLTSVFLAGFAPGGEAIANWSAPATWSSPRAPGVTTLSETFPLPFIAVTPCRIADTRNPAGPYGAPALAGGVPRNFTLTGVCGIPSSAAAASLNVTVTNTQGPGFILIYPQGGSQPTVSTLNYIAGQTIANAAVVPLSSGGAVTVIAGVSGTDLILDVNGYYSSTLGNPQNYFFIDNNSTLFSIYSKNSSATCNGACGVLSEVYSTNAAGGAAIWGDALGATGSHIGVRGRTFSSSAGTYGVYGTVASTASDAAGVRGTDGSGAPALGSSRPSAGVRGESESNIGVYGFSGNLAVVGEYVAGMGTVATGELGRASGPYGVFSIGDIGVSSGMKFFVEPHPTDASKVIRYVSLEGRESGTYFRARTRCMGGMAVVPVPQDFATVTDENDLSVQATAIGKLANFAVEKLDLAEIVLACSRDVEVFITVNGVRRAFKDLQPVREGSEFMPRSADERMPAYLTEEDKRRLIANGSYNQDGTVNMETAERLGWAKAWRDREERAKTAAANEAARAARLAEKK